MIVSSRSRIARVAGVAHAVDLLVDVGFFFDERVGARDVGLRLVIVVIRHEIFDRVLREEILELAVKLKRERLVRRQYKRGALYAFDHLGHRERLARAGDAEQDLILFLRIGAGDEIANGRRLIARRLIIAGELEGLAAFQPLPRASGRCGVHSSAFLSKAAAGDWKGERGMNGKIGAARPGTPVRASRRPPRFYACARGPMMAARRGTNGAVK